MMSTATGAKLSADLQPKKVDLSSYVPDELGEINNLQTAIPRFAKDLGAVAKIENAVRTVPTSHNLLLGDARLISAIPSDSAHLVLTSPPYWTLKEYRDSAAQLGHVDDYDEFLAELDKCGNTVSAS